MEFHESDLKSLLLDHHASLVGFADLRECEVGDLHYGVSIALKLPKEIVKGITGGPTRNYFDTYHEWNAKLHDLARLGASYLESCGFRALAQTSDVVKQNVECRTRLPHKTVAVNSGLGWIGKCALLVTKEYGSAVRLTSILTDAPLTCGIPFEESKCKTCHACQDACPGQAVKGAAWKKGMDREELYDFSKCREAAGKLSRARLQEEITLCGKCIEVCPYTQRYLKH